ncbi:hypothetical protein [Domibacillus mangrovi]|uniref:Uncharacterized protein n=1 Tax=Domibacillus mangrovi TaxID=1714354 RepID=A0A1Q5P7U4_9BACI|nr:hypothetical protein [Domibacillus mangrovi]OKL38350.1 hypothetical protein BLL40_02730 [Domibacillus mangrovi]
MLCEKISIYKTSKAKNIAKKFKYDSKAYEHASTNRYVPRHIIANTIVYGKKEKDGAKGYNKYTTTIYKNNVPRNFKVVYNPKTKKVRHYHYSDKKKKKK